MAHTKTLILTLACWLLAIGLQAQQYYFSIEQRVPAALPVAGLSDGAFGRVLLVNNSMVQPLEFGHQNKVEDAVVGGDSVDLSAAARHILFGMENTLYETHVMEEVQVLDASQCLSTSFYKRMPLSRQRADSLCTLYDADAVLSLNQVIIYDLQEVYYTDDNDYYGYLAGYCSTQWAFHPKGGNAQAFTTADTLYWQTNSNQLGEAFRALPPRKEALLELAFYSGEQIGLRLFPQWQTQDRYLYATDHAPLQAGLEAFRRQRWQEALDIWKRVVNSRIDLTTRAYAAADAALAAEMMEDYKLAQDMAQQAEDLFLSLRSRSGNQQVINLRYYRQQLSASRTHAHANNK